MERTGGVLAHITSLPSPYGVGTLGRAAYAFADFLAKAGQRCWQMLPLGPTGYGDSPYQCASAFAGNPYLIDLDLLVDDGLLERAEAETVEWGADASRVDYGALYRGRLDVLRKAYLRGRARDAAAVAAFRAQNAHWLEEYALFDALKARFDGRMWIDWDAPVRLREPEALAYWRETLCDEIALRVYMQYLFDRQWRALRAYVNAHGIRIIGDLPIYVPFDSADVWQHPEQFQLEADGRPLVVAGVPPDYFSCDGQLWGNPIYDWTRMEADGFGWWLARIDAARRLFDAVRIDHFRGLDSYWAVPYGAETAAAGEWRPGPGMAFIDAVKGAFPDLFVIAEDLGVFAPSVDVLLDRSGFPGMRVLAFAFDASRASTHLPHYYRHNCVAYTSTHDNLPIMGWVERADPRDVGFACAYLGLNEAEGMHLGLIRGVLASVADLAIVPIQDWLGLGASARMNEPSTLVGNWQFRLLPGQLTDALAETMAAYAALFGRA